LKDKINPQWLLEFDAMLMNRSGFKASDHVREQGVPRVENGVRHTFWRMSISSAGQSATNIGGLSDISWGFEATSNWKLQTAL